MTDTFDPSRIDPDETYTVAFDRDGWPVREIDIETGEITDEFLRGPEVCQRIKMSGRELLRVIEANTNRKSRSDAWEPDSGSEGTPAGFAC